MPKPDNKKARLFKVSLFLQAGGLEQAERQSGRAGRAGRAGGGQAGWLERQSRQSRQSGWSGWSDGQKYTGGGKNRQR